MKVKQFSLRDYLERALALAEYERDENGMFVARVPNTDGFYAQGNSVEEARHELTDVIEGNIILALQLGFEIPKLPGIDFAEQDFVQTHTA
jgi:predicted RNase H-like HicB family nuclease